MFSKKVFVQKIKATLIHFLFTCFIAVCSAYIVFCVFYPSPYTAISDGFNLWKILIFVELALGPMMSLVIYNPSKSIKQLLFDYSIVAVIQVAALLYGMSTVYNARPVLVVFVKDRFEVTVKSDYVKDDWLSAKKWKQDFVGPTLMSVRFAENPEEQKELMFDTVSSGRDIHLRPKYYKDIDKLELSEALNPLLTLSNMLEPNKHEKQKQRVLKYGANHYWLPIVNGFSYWVAVVNNDTHEIVDVIDVDPWALARQK